MHEEEEDYYDSTKPVYTSELGLLPRHFARNSRMPYAYRKPSPMAH